LTSNPINIPFIRALNLRPTTLSRPGAYDNRGTVLQIQPRQKVNTFPKTPRCLDPSAKGQLHASTTHNSLPRERPKLLLNRLRRRHTRVDPQPIPQLQRLAGFDRVRCSKVSGRSHPAVVANVKDVRVI